MLFNGTETQPHPHGICHQTAREEGARWQHCLPSGGTEGKNYPKHGGNTLRFSGQNQAVFFFLTPSSVFFRGKTKQCFFFKHQAFFFRGKTKQCFFLNTKQCFFFGGKPSSFFFLNTKQCFFSGENQAVFFFKHKAVFFFRGKTKQCFFFF